VVNPGGRLGYRRVPPSLFATAAHALAAGGISPVVTWGPGEEGLADEVLALAPSARRAPPTSLDDLAWLMATSVLTVCNNTGPMHLSVAVGTPTLGLFLHMDMERWGHPAPPHRMVDVTEAVAAGKGEEAVLTALGAWLPTLQARREAPRA
jgi:ADP-heptose:LPS heptosyltransferase